MNYEQLQNVVDAQVQAATSKIETLKNELAIVTDMQGKFEAAGQQAPSFVTNEYNKLLAAISAAQKTTMVLVIKINDDFETEYEINQAASVTKKSVTTTGGTNAVLVDGIAYKSGFDGYDAACAKIGIAIPQKRDFDAQVKLFTLAMQGKIDYERNDIKVIGGVFSGNSESLTEPMKKVLIAYTTK